MATIAKLKRVKINVLAYHTSQKTTVVDNTYSDYDKNETNLFRFDVLDEKYLFSYFAGLTHIVLAPSRYMRIPFAIKDEVRWEPETVWGLKLDTAGEHQDSVEYIGEGSAAYLSDDGSKSNVLKLVKDTEPSTDQYLN